MFRSCCIHSSLSKGKGAPTDFWMILFFFFSGLGNFSAVLMFPILMYNFKLGVTGAAISTVASQYVLRPIESSFSLTIPKLNNDTITFTFFRYIVTLLMIWYLNKRTIISFPNMKNLHFGDYLRSGDCPFFS